MCMVTKVTIAGLARVNSLPEKIHYAAGCLQPQKQTVYASTYCITRNVHRLRFQQKLIRSN